MVLLAERVSFIKTLNPESTVPAYILVLFSWPLAVGTVMDGRGRGGRSGMGLLGDGVWVFGRADLEAVYNTVSGSVWLDICTLPLGGPVSGFLCWPCLFVLLRLFEVWGGGPVFSGCRGWLDWEGWGWWPPPVGI